MYSRAPRPMTAQCAFSDSCTYTRVSVNPMSMRSRDSLESRFIIWIRRVERTLRMILAQRRLLGAGRLKDRDALLDQRDVARARSEAEIRPQRHDRGADLALLSVRESQPAESGGVGRHVAEDLAIRPDRRGGI